MKRYVSANDKRTRVGTQNESQAILTVGLAFIVKFCGKFESESRIVTWLAVMKLYNNKWPRGKNERSNNLKC